MVFKEIFLVYLEQNHARFGRITANTGTMSVNLHEYESLFKIYIMLLLAHMNSFGCKFFRKLQTFIYPKNVLFYSSYKR